MHYGANVEEYHKWFKGSGKSQPAEPISIISSQPRSGGSKMIKNIKLIALIFDDRQKGVHVRIGQLPLCSDTIDKGAIIGAAGAVVTHDVPEFSVAVGVPAKVIKTI